MEIRGKMNRRKFVKESAIIATTAGVTVLMINSGMQPVAASDHTEFLKNGGCDKLINALSKSSNT